MTLLTSIVALSFIGFYSMGQTTTDSLFSGISKFEKNAASTVRVESDRDRDRDRTGGTSSAAAGPQRFSNVYVFKYEQPGQYDVSAVEAYRRKLQTPEWTCKVCPGHQAGETTEACTRPLGSSAVESAVIVEKLRELTFIHSVGGIGKHESSCETD